MPSVPPGPPGLSPQNFLPIKNASQYGNDGQAACSPDALLDDNNRHHCMQQSLATPAPQFQAPQHMRGGIGFQQHQLRSHNGRSHPNPQSLYGQSSNSLGHAMPKSRVNSAADPHMDLNQLQLQVSGLTLDLPTQQNVVHKLRCLFGAKQREIDRLKRDLLKSQSEMGSFQQALKSQSDRMDKSWMTKDKHRKEMAKQEEKMIKYEQELRDLRQQYKSEQFALRKESKRQKREFMTRIASQDGVLGRTREEVDVLRQKNAEQLEKLVERSRIIQEWERRVQDDEYLVARLYSGQLAD